MSRVPTAQESALDDVRREYGLRSWVVEGADIIARDDDGDRWRIKPSGERWAITITGERVHNRPSREPRGEA